MEEKVRFEGMIGGPTGCIEQIYQGKRSKGQARAGLRVAATTDDGLRRSWLGCTAKLLPFLFLISFQQEIITEKVKCHTYCNLYRNTIIFLVTISNHKTCAKVNQMHGRETID